MTDPLPLLVINLINISRGRFFLFNETFDCMSNDASWRDLVPQLAVITCLNESCNNFNCIFLHCWRQCSSLITVLNIDFVSRMKQTCNHILIWQLSLMTNVANIRGEFVPFLAYPSLLTGVPVVTNLQLQSNCYHRKLNKAVYTSLSIHSVMATYKIKHNVSCLW